MSNLTNGEVAFLSQKVGIKSARADLPREAVSVFFCEQLK